MKFLKETLYLFYFLIIFPCEAMQLPNLPKIPKFLEALLQDHEIDQARTPPPFYKLTTYDDREVYILGSIHIIHPQLLLPAPCFQQLMNIHRDGAILFTESAEHEIPTINPVHLLTGVTEMSPSMWNIEDYLHQDDYETWQLITGGWTQQTIEDYTKLPNLNHKIIKITKISANVGISFFYQKMGTKYLQISPGFENSLEKLNWLGKEALETGGDVVNSMADDQSVLKKLFHSALDTFALLYTYENENPVEAQEIIIINYKNEISKYSHLECMTQYMTHFHLAVERREPSNIIDISTIKRNIEWGKKIHAYLTTPHQNNRRPILIVCGYGHLYGGLIQGCSSFLRILWDSGLFKKSEIMLQDGSWVEHAPGNKNVQSIRMTF
jgi:hypothetical protein